MQLLVIEEKIWSVLAYCDDDGCQVLDLLMGLTNNHGAKKMLNNLNEYIPVNGPNYRNNQKVKNLRDKIFELREQPSRGPKIRVLFFRSGTSQIICTNAFEKDQQSTPENEIEKAIEIRDRYYADKDNNNLEFINLES